ncbi:hypothetical protein FKM82_016284 [Ascaphus truei]
MKVNNSCTWQDTKGFWRVNGEEVSGPGLRAAHIKKTRRSIPEQREPPITWTSQYRRTDVTRAREDVLAANTVQAAVNAL